MRLSLPGANPSPISIIKNLSIADLIVAPKIASSIFYPFMNRCTVQSSKCFSARRITGIDNKSDTNRFNHDFHVFRFNDSYLSCSYDRGGDRGRDSDTHLSVCDSCPDHCGRECRFFSDSHCTGCNCPPDDYGDNRGPDSCAHRFYRDSCAN